MIPEHYHISEDGNVVNKKTGIQLKNHEDKDGYLYVNLRINKKQKHFRVHRLVLMSYKPIDLMETFQVNHKDGNRKNNALSNLEWCTAKENIHDKIKRGSHSRKLKFEDVEVIRQLYFNTKTSLRKLGKMFNVDHKGILKIINNEAYVVF